LQIRIGFDLTYQLTQATPMVVMLHVHPSRAGDLQSPETLHGTPSVVLDGYVDGFGNRCTRLVAPAGRLRLFSEAIIRDSGLPDPVRPEAGQFAIPDLPHEALVFLLGSRYCETDQLADTAWSLFGSTPPGWPRVQAICDFVHREVRFGYEHADATKSASGVLQTRAGVCRDFAHLAIALCRCMNIPARYYTGYLGDIGVPPADAPMDFSAWFEAYLDGGWHVFDARHNVPRIGRVLMARGRDASDVAFSTSFGRNSLVGFEVRTEEIVS
jgi:transglutaminase-like putative cysteine protease